MKIVKKVVCIDNTFYNIIHPKIKKNLNFQSSFTTDSILFIYTLYSLYNTYFIV